VVGPDLLRAQEASPSADGSAILAAYGEAWSSGEAAQVAALYTEEAVREDVPTGTTSRGRAEIEALAAGIFATDADVRLDVTGGFAGESWAVVEWTFSGRRQASGDEVSFRGVSVLELEDGRISRESDYYDLPQMQQQIAAAGGTPGAVETAADTDATPAPYGIAGNHSRGAVDLVSARVGFVAGRRGSRQPAAPLHAPAAGLWMGRPMSSSVTPPRRTSPSFGKRWGVIRARLLTSPPTARQAY
jgi:steroid delta-isomerase-like uncharacterized protein